MKILILGASGPIGRAALWDLARDPEVREVGVVGRRREPLEQAVAWAGGGPVTVHAANVLDRTAMLRLMTEYDAGVLALPTRRASYRAVEHAIEAGLPIVDVLEEYHRRPDLYETEGLDLPRGELTAYGEDLHRRAVERGVTFIDGMGLAPGLTNITLGEGIRELDSVDSAVARVGGVPSPESAPHHPLRYMITWAFDHVLREYVVRLQIRRGGEVVEVEAGSERERFRFPARGGTVELECAITPGMPSFVYTRPELSDFSEKTVRWPGHWQAVETLRECGLLDLEPIEHRGMPVVPREFFSQLVTPRLEPRPGDSDVSVMYNTLTGTRGGRPATLEYRLWDEADPVHGLSSMMRTTAFPATVTARMLARRRIPEKGIVAPEDGIRGELYREMLAELAERGIVIDKTLVAAEEPVAVA